MTRPTPLRPILLVLALLATWPAAAEDAPPPFTIEEATIAEVEAALAEGRISCPALVGAYLDRIAALEAPAEGGRTLDAIRAVNPDALEEAAALEALPPDERARRPLFCVPLLVKDNYDAAGLPTTAGSRALEGIVADADAFVLQRLRAAGAIVLAKTNMSELALFGSSLNSWTGDVGSAYDATRDAGGSSAGSAAALAANAGLVALGTDTCGSNRIPAANNALVGFRGTLGLVSRTGIVPLSRLRDAPGPMARSVADLAAVLDIMAAADPLDDSTAVAGRIQPASYLSGLSAATLVGKRIGVLRTLGEDATFGTDPDVAAAMAQAIADLAAAGATVIDDLALPDFQPLNTTPFEAGELLDRYLRSLADPPVADFAALAASDRTLPASHALLEGALTLSTGSGDFIGAAAARPATRAMATALFDRYDLDALVFPTVRGPPPLRGAEDQASNCELASSTGLPSVVVPMGWSHDTPALPLSIELFGRAWDEADLLALAYAYEQATHHRRPPSE